MAANVRRSVLAGTSTLPPWKPILPFVLPQRWPTRLPLPLRHAVQGAGHRASSGICPVENLLFDAVPAAMAPTGQLLGVQCEKKEPSERKGKFAIAAAMAQVSPDCSALPATQADRVLGALLETSEPMILAQMLTCPNFRPYARRRAAPGLASQHRRRLKATLPAL